MDLIPMDIGPLNPKVPELVVGVVLFALVFLFFVRLLPRLQRTLDEREARTKGAEAQAEAVRAEAAAKQAEVAAALADARHEAARIRQQAFEQGAALIAEARAAALREQQRILSDGHAQIITDRTTAEAELRTYAAELASNLAGKVIGEPIEAGAHPRP
ncbi:F0F1 ATP synthase subunit B family protein [Streptomyces sp. NPDC002643]